MKTIKFIPQALVVLAAILLSFTTFRGGSIKGKVVPADGGFQACAVAGTDSFKTNILGGSFEIKNLKPGSYSLLVISAAPFKNLIKEGIEVTEGNATDIGDLQLQK